MGCVVAQIKPPSKGMKENERWEEGQKKRAKAADICRRTSTEGRMGGQSWVESVSTRAVATGWHIKRIQGRTMKGKQKKKRRGKRLMNREDGGGWVARWVESEIQNQFARVK